MLKLLDIWGFYGKNGVLFGFFLIFSIDSLFCASEMIDLESHLESERNKGFAARLKEGVMQTG